MVAVRPAASMPAVTVSESVPAAGRKRRLGLWIGLGAGVLVLMVVAGVIVAGTAVGYVSGHQSYQITSGNMEPTLKPGDRVLADKVGGGHYRPRRGDITVFTPPSAWATNGQSGKHISRVIAVPGDTISCGGGDKPPAVNGKALDEPYARGGCGDAPYSTKIPSGRLWLLGDNRADSYDSHIVYLKTEDLSSATVAASAVVAVIKEVSTGSPGGGTAG